MERCPNCMREYKGSAKFCPFCGYEINKMSDGYQLSPGTVLEDRYTLGTTIGIGGFGIIYRAWDNKLDTVVAVKECFPAGLVNRTPGDTTVEVVKNGSKEKQYRDKVRRFLSEAQTMARFSEHENIVHVFDYFEANNTAYFVMEYLDGCNLKKKTSKEKLSVDESVDIIIKICSVLKYMHNEKIIHRDINLNNIMICKNGNIKLIDFGTARAQFGELSKGLTAELTPGYAPPEQYQTNGNQGPWTDVYALCATLYHLVTGIKPEESVDRVREDLLVPPMEINPDVPEWLDRTIMSGLAVDYHLRFQNVDELVNALSQKKKALYPDEVIRKQKNFRSLIAACVLLVFLVSLGGFFAYRASYHGWFVQDGTLTLWLPDNSFGQSIQKESEKYEERYGGKKLDIRLIGEVSYSDMIAEAAENGTLPDILAAVGGNAGISDKLADVSDLIETNSDDDHSLISRNKRYLSQNRIIPLSFNTIVMYENTSASGELESPYKLSGKFDLSKNKPSTDSSHTLFDKSSHLVTSVIPEFNESDGVQGALSEFTDVDKQTVPYYFGSTSERRTVQNALPGYNEIYGVSNGKTMYAEFCDQLCVSKQSYGEKQELIDLLINYLLSSDVQSDMYLQNDKPLPVERATYAHYVETIDSLSFLTDEYEHFEIVE